MQVRHRPPGTVERPRVGDLYCPDCRRLTWAAECAARERCACVPSAEEVARRGRWLREAARGMVNAGFEYGLPWDWEFGALLALVTPAARREILARLEEVRL
ncbi:MAG: hypothetical protein FJX77_03060 [Armatimonadetes bacterium]|nr:hypothetical protein [Armatimonadota bacterium]